jgi:hypothetical protein
MKRTFLIASPSRGLIFVALQVLNLEPDARGALIMTQTTAKDNFILRIRFLPKEKICNWMSSLWPMTEMTEAKHMERFRDSEIQDSRFKIQDSEFFLTLAVFWFINTCYTVSSLRMYSTGALPYLGFALF